MSRLQLICLSLACISLPAFAAIGDNAPSVPSAWVASHPRLGAPNSSQLAAIWNGGSIPSAILNDANSWDNCNTPSLCSKGHIFRHLLMAYMAAKQGGANLAAAPYSTWKANLTTMAELGPSWGQTWITETAGSGDGSGNITLTTAGLNLTTACNSGSCAGSYLEWNGYTYAIASVSSATQASLNKLSLDSPYPFPSGSGQRLSVLSIGGRSVSGMLYAMMYDWLYSDWVAAGLDGYMQTALGDWLTQEENEYVNANYYPYNDEGFCNAGNSWDGCNGVVAAAFSIYPDAGATGLKHWRWTTDWLFNILLPAEKQVMLGDGRCLSTSDCPDGGGWHESWSTYGNSSQVDGGGVHGMVVTPWLMWANASGRGTNFFTVDNPWLKNFAYWTMYIAKPDFTVLHYGDVTYPILTQESDITDGGLEIDAIEGLGEIYNDSAIRGWARLMTNNASPNGFEPSAYPYFTPDNASNIVPGTADPRASLPLCHNFTGWGLLVCRSDWTEQATMVSLKYGDNFWSKPNADTGNFTIYSSGNLAIKSGAYISGIVSRHFIKYGMQAVANNVVTVKDSGENFASQLVEVTPYSTAQDCEALPNDGGQRRVGSGWQDYWSNSACTGGATANTFISSVPDKGAWYRGWSFYHQANLLAYACSPNCSAPAYIYAAVDVTPAYQTDFSGNTSAPGYGMENRTQRLQRNIRHFLFIPHGHLGYVVTFDAVTSTNAAFTKKWLLHTLNQPTISSNQYTVLRTEDAESRPYGGYIAPSWALALAANKNACGGLTNWCYQYNGKLIGYNLTSDTLSTVGGAGHEFDDGTGTNQPECEASQPCSDSTNSEGLGNTSTGCTAGFICTSGTQGSSAFGPMEPGAYRIEETPATSETEDYFLNVMLAGPNVVGTAFSTAPTLRALGSGVTATLGATWKDTSDTCTYTADFNKYGPGLTITIQGAGCLNVVN